MAAIHSLLRRPWRIGFRRQSPPGAPIFASIVVGLLCCACGGPGEAIATPVPPTPETVASATSEPSETPEPPTATREPSETPRPPTATREPSETPEPPTATREPSPTRRRATATREPSETPRPPTATRRPSATRTLAPTTPPTETPDARATEVALAEEDAYRQWLVTVVRQYAAGVERIGALSIQVSENRFTFFNPGWHTEMDTNIALIRDASRQVIERTPPDRYTGFHAEFVELAHLYNEAMTTLEEGIDEQDAEKIQRASDLTIQATDGLGDLPFEELR
ncbi:MAG TPA: hypothetical protein VER55_15515 [Ardenticatenaceae bacterium]|nr:hypothetical protein [Ardenticatenaceae bacterium]